ncbi:MAG: DUF3106 domain-containing protein [Pseudomonadota bacterium]|nr:DUF3106 domain-containing protein [Pseudomonadota bacterium]
MDQAPTWASLSPAQQQALTPLQREWPYVDARRKQKWLEVASRYTAMSHDEQVRVQARMDEWLALSPTERARARLQFQELKQVPADERQERWRAYQALSPEERKRLAKEARPAPKTALPNEAASAMRRKSTPVATRQHLADPATAGVAGAAVIRAATPLAGAQPLAVQARPGATTNTSGARPLPPLHHHAGLPKIAATAGFVDPATLLPKRGPQGAAVRAEPAVAPVASGARP